MLNYEQHRAWPELPKDDTISYESVDIFDVFSLFIFLLISWSFSLLLLLIEMISFRISVYRFRKKQQRWKEKLLLLRLHEMTFHLRKQNCMKNIKNWGNFYKKHKILGGFHKIKDQMLVFIFFFTQYTSVLLKMGLYPEIYIESC